MIPLLPLQAEGDVLAAILEFLPLIVLIVILVPIMLWLLAWMSRYFEYLKTVESAWLDRETLDFVRRVLEGVWIAFIALIVLAIAQTRSQVLRDILAAFVLRVPALFFVVFVLFTAAVLVRALHRFAAYLRGELTAKPKKIAPPSALAFAEIVLKYVIYVVALVAAILGGIQALPASDQAFIAQNIGTVPGIEPVMALEVLAGILVVVLADRLVNSIFEDMKRRTAKFSQRVMDEFKALARYGVWAIGAVVILFVFLDLVLSEGRLVIFAVGFVAFMILVGFFGFDTMRNVLAGVALLRGNPFDIGDRVKIGNDLVGDVVSMSLTTTSLRTLRGELVQLPNREILQLPVVNFSRSKPYAIFLEVAVDFDVGHNRIEDLLTRAAKETEGIVQARPPEVFGKDVQGDAVVYQLYAYTDRPERMKEIKSSLIFRIQDLFREAGIRPRGPASGS